jgi:hypothetical protein
MAIFSSITVFLVVLECHFNIWDASNGHIDSSWRSPILCGSSIPTRFKFRKPTFCEVFSRNSHSFSFFLLSFLTFFPVIRVSGFLFPFLFLRSSSVVTSHCGCSFRGFNCNTSSLIIPRVDALISSMDRFFKPSWVLSTSTTTSLSLYFFDLSSCISRSIFLAMKSLNSCFFCSVASSFVFLLI